MGVVEVATENGDGPGLRGAGRSDRGRALCAAFIEALPVTGGSISIVAESGGHSIVGATDLVAATLEAWQFEAGVGPHWDALRTEQPAFLYDATDPHQLDGWPALAFNQVPDGARALFAFPLKLGAAVVGVADLYSRDPAGPWSRRTMETARDVASQVTTPAVLLATRSAGSEHSETGPNAVELRREVHQATGIVMSQLDSSASTALLRLRGHAFASGVSLDALSRDVIARRIDFAAL